MRPNEIIADHRPDIVIGQKRELVQLMRRAETVEEVQERNPALERRRLCDQRQVVGLLYRAGREQAKPLERMAITSEWSPKIDNAWVATARAAT
jgi:hypothetical protein